MQTTVLATAVRDILLGQEWGQDARPPSRNITGSCTAPVTASLSTQTNRPYPICTIRLSNSCASTETGGLGQQAISRDIIDKDSLIERIRMNSPRPGTTQTGSCFGKRQKCWTQKRTNLHQKAFKPATVCAVWVLVVLFVAQTAAPASQQTNCWPARWVAWLLILSLLPSVCVFVQSSSYTINT